MFDLQVIGAGPTGLIAAISAIRAHNVNVQINEEHKKPGFPVNCSGLFSSNGLDSLREFIDYKKTILNRIRGAVIDLAGSRLEIDSKKEIAYVCDRAEFDRILAENAEREGAKIIYGKRIVSDFESNNIIGADGPNSSVASYFGFPKIRCFVSTLQAIVDYEAVDSGIVELFFSNSLFPGFFGWFIPRNEEQAEVGCGVVLPNNVANAFNSIVRLKKIKIKQKPVGFLIPIERRAKTSLSINRKNILLVGDAAGQTKTTTGGGVIFGGNCAKLAGLHYNNPLLYELKWRFSLGFDFYAHSLIHNFLASRTDVQLRQLGEKLKSAGLESYLSEKGDMDRPSKMLNPELLKVLLRAL